MITTVLKISNPVGLHARPGGMLAEKAQQYKCAVSIRKTDSEKTVDAKSLISILIGQFAQGNEVELVCDGEDEKEAIRDITDLINSMNE